MSNGRFNRAVDSSLQIVAAGTTLTPATTANSTGVAIGSIGSGDLDLGVMINIESLTGTHDASNYIQLQLQASDDDSTYVTLETLALNTADASAENQTGANLLAINTREIVEAVVDATHYRILATRTGTTGTAVVFSAHFVEGV